MVIQTVNTSEGLPRAAGFDQREAALFVGESDRTGIDVVDLEVSISNWGKARPMPLEPADAALSPPSLQGFGAPPPLPCLA